MHSLEQIIKRNNPQAVKPSIVYFTASSLSLQSIGIIGASAQDSGLLSSYDSISKELDSGAKLHTIVASVKESDKAKLFSLIAKAWNDKRDDWKESRLRIVSAEKAKATLEV